ncbi:MAG: transglutaminase family protein [Polyangiaceae bacterium]
MSIHVALHHVTRYRYDRPISLGPQLIRLRPAPHCRSRVLSYSLRVSPAKHFINWQQDPESNFVARLVFPEQTREFVITVDLVAEMAVINPFDFFLEPSAEKFPFEYDARQKKDLEPYFETLPSTPLFEKFLASIPRDEKPSVPFLVGVNQLLSEHIKYVIRLEPGLQTPEETLTKKSGSCRDSAWLLVQLLRRMGLAARFVSGYLIQLTADVPSLDGPSGPPADFTDLHAWCEVYLPGAGWVGLDPTSGLFAGEGHLPLACTPDPRSAAPVTGVLDKAEVEFEHEMSVRRVWEAPRVTRPYTEEQWAEIEALGHAVDRDLSAGDIRLTMGGEPTFVSIDDPNGDEWNTAALGPTKKRRSADLFRRLRERYAPKGLVHFGQGKWYPGEPLPRWSLTCFFRHDGEPLWADSSWIADEDAPAGADHELAGRFLRGVAERLGLDAKWVFPAYEDVYHTLWRERRLPSNVDPFDARLDDPLERDRLRRLFTQGLSTEAGHVLPVEPAGNGTFRSGPWFLRDERCYLIPGDSPVGFRLPLDSLPWAAAEDRPLITTPDPAQAQPPLAAHAVLLRQAAEFSAIRSEGRAVDARGGDPMATRAPRIHGSGQSDVGYPGKGENADRIRGGGQSDSGPRRVKDGSEEACPRPEMHQSAAWVTRTAMCAEARKGVLYVFMPPVSSADDYVALVAAVEATARALNHPVLLEGYEPPKDPRIGHFRITPDPGVIEVNIHPAADWGELVDRTTFLYEAARLSRLTTEKFMLDGRHSGTGGGNHMVLGGATVHDSPFLRRPDLLRSLISYWLNHPSLSFLFSGLFIGPTSQAPRIDEARHDAVFEIETAFREMERQTGIFQKAPPPWLVDRLLRNLLCDVTGNTHRTEICIDKLFSPDGPAGRHGLVEMRAFEMPPHARMSLAQQLLLRALVARFWKKPYSPSRLKRWGTELHDRFMLPYFVWDDFLDVLTECREAGYPLKPEYFHPHFEFRFPKYGDFGFRGIDLEIRAALEPWHVLGEEAMSGGTARFVDSSLERLQIKVSGFSPERYAITCNGHAAPMRPAGRVGEYVAGVRYRAWQPPSCLHPTIGVHSPLTFDIVDLWMDRSLGGCQYHVMHPGGRNFEVFPVNAFEAEGRRLARFFRMGHTPGELKVAPPSPSTDFPFTLDLRQR